MAITLNGARLDNEAAVTEAFRGFSNEDLEALRHEGGRLAVQVAERVLHERSHKLALEHELATAKSDAGMFKAQVDWHKAALKRSPSGSERVSLEDALKGWEARLSGAVDNASAVEQALKG